MASYPCKVREIETCWIPMPDGVKLAARLWLPEDAERQPVPAILEYIPYRRRDGTRDGDQLTHPYLAGHGYACVRLDIRGSGDSEGLQGDEYAQLEQDDAVEAIAWIAAQPWCSGAVGMMGISWGGFNSLQVAACRPPALKAIVTACSTDDRYADDMHYMGGCSLTGNLEWGSQFFIYQGRAPDPRIVGERWRAMWMERLANVTPHFESWLRHQHRDRFWKHGSICEDFARVECAVLAVGGWADGYSNAVLRLLRGLAGPRLGIVGPWGHKYPHNGVPGPAIGFLQESLRWWDHWLEGRDTGIMREPMLRAWMQESVPPRPHYDERPGRWVGEPAWPSPDIEPRRFALDPGRLGELTAPMTTLTVASPQSTGAAAGEWCPYGLGGLGPELPLDQREDDGKSLVFDGDALPERIEILGAPVANLVVAADRPNAIAVVRLNDVAPDGGSTRVTFGVLNLTHRAGHERPRALAPGKFYKVRIQLNDIAHAFPAGHRIRLAVSTAYWPMVWPSPEPVRLSLRTRVSALELPIRTSREEDSRIAFQPAVTSAPLERTVVRPGKVKRTQVLDIASNAVETTVLRDDGASIIEEIGTRTEFVKTLRYRIGDDDPTSAKAETEMSIAYDHADWHPHVKTRTSVACTRDDFHVQADIEAFEGDIRVFSRSWSRRVPRKLA